MTRDYEQHKKEPFAGCENPNVPMGKWLLKELPVAPTRILDVGCGTGVHTKWFNEQGIDCTGITINKSEIAKRVHDNVIYGDMLSIPFGDKEFDCVFALGVLEHTHSPFVALCEFNRVLQQGKYLFLDMCGIRCMMVQDPRYWYHKNVLFPIQIRDMLLRSSFDLIGGHWNEKIDDNMYVGNANAHYLARKSEDVKL